MIPPIRQSIKYEFEEIIPEETQVVAATPPDGGRIAEPESASFTRSCLARTSHRRGERHNPLTHGTPSPRIELCPAMVFVTRPYSERRVQMRARLQLRTVRSDGIETTVSNSRTAKSQAAGAPTQDSYYPATVDAQLMASLADECNLSNLVFKVYVEHALVGCTENGEGLSPLAEMFRVCSPRPRACTWQDGDTFTTQNPHRGGSSGSFNYMSNYEHQSTARTLHRGRRFFCTPCHA